MQIVKELKAPLEGYVKNKKGKIETTIDWKNLSLPLHNKHVLYEQILERIWNI